MRRFFAPGFAFAFLISLLCCYSCGRDEYASQGVVHLSKTEAGDYQLIRNGKPFLIQGGSGNSHLDVLREFGGNTVRVYDPANLAAVLDEAEANGLAVIADIPVPPYHRLGGDEAAEIRNTKAALLEVVATHRDHPALLFWMLGNELFQDGFDSDYLAAYNELVADLRALDPGHPVSTTVISHQMVDIHLKWNTPKVDFYSFNVFGNVANLDRVRTLLSLRWTGPYLISEWSYNGPWESDNTSWNAPVEPPAAAKARQLEERYRDHVSSATDGRVLGSMAFYWGNKYERTPTWFSLFGADGEISPMAFSLRNCWQQQQLPFPGPKIEYLLLDGKGSLESILLRGGQTAEVTVHYSEPPAPGVRVNWEIRLEDWQHEGEEGVGPEPIAGRFVASTVDAATFRVPEAEGAYRIYCNISDGNGYFATANVPFYSLSGTDAK